MLNFYSTFPQLSFIFLRAKDLDDQDLFPAVWFM